MTGFTRACASDLNIRMRYKFDLVPATSVQARKYGRSRQRKERRKQDRRYAAEQAVDRIAAEWNRSGGELSEEQAVKLALLGVPWYWFLLRILLTDVAKWAIRQLVINYD